MKLSNVKLIFLREVRDQLRDRRTLFMIFVLPLLLYPLLGMSFFQVVQFMHEHPARVQIIGLKPIDDLPALVEGDRIAEGWLGGPMKDNPIAVELAEQPSDKTGDEIATEAKEAIRSEKFQTVVYFPADFGDQLEALRKQMVDRDTGKSQGGAVPAIPQPVVYFSGADEKSQFTHSRVEAALRRWTDAIGQKLLKDSNLPSVAAHPFEMQQSDVAELAQRQAVVWSKILPFVLLIWALTGAFYPAIDLCAGEKERGTLETLLSSPAERSEIVTGKLLTIMLFSVATSVLNLVSMGVTGAFVLNQLQTVGAGTPMGLPPALAPLWLLVALVPVSALFSALCLALASFARSNKEGQYYLMPLVLVSMPLMILPMAPGVELTLGNSLIPLTGLVLLLRSLLEGEYLAALPYIPPVVLVTLVCCVLALRWAIDQFNKESVLFRESERLDMGLWLRHLVRDRQDTPSAAEAIFCGVLILVIQFFMSLAMPAPGTFADIARLILVSQVVVIATPALVMAVMLTRRPLRTLLVQKPPRLAIPMAILLAACLHPLVLLLQRGLAALYPMGEHAKGLGQVFNLLNDAPYWWLPIVLVAVTPAICEELAFRGFVLSGLRHLGHRWGAILLSAVFFGITHPLLQQSIVATVVGVVIGYLAVQTGSIFPGMLFHITHNALVMLSARINVELVDRYPNLNWLVDTTNAEELTYRPVVLGIAAFLAAMLLTYFVRLAPARSEEEALQETIDRRRQQAKPAPPFALNGATVSENGAALHEGERSQTPV
jgi:sodium transport system permease protein